ncbi:MAG: hypothetical protein AB7N91_06205 [Candidatus Tectimicrobiota bacterium]
MEPMQVCSICKQTVDVFCAAHPEAHLDVVQIDYAPHLQHCSHCGQALSTTNIRLALEDIGEGLALERITLCCPGHLEDTGCPHYGADDHHIMAYWYLI